MTSARRLYRFELGVALLAIGVVVLSLALAAGALRFALPSPQVLLEACRGLLPAAEPGAFVLLAPAALAVVAVGLGARSLWRQLLAARRFVRGLAIAGSGAYAAPEAILFHGERPQAFCAGLLRPRIYLSTAAARLPHRHVSAVVAHERHHARRRDPLRILLARVLSDALFFVPVLRRMTERYVALAELAADEAAARTHGKPTLAAALLSFGQARSPAVVAGIAPERVDNLLGRAPRWELPVSLLLGSGVSIAGVVSAALAGRALTAGAMLNLPLLLAQSCMLLMLALPPLLAAAALLLGRSPRRP